MRWWPFAVLGLAAGDYTLVVTVPGHGTVRRTVTIRRSTFNIETLRLP